MLSLARFIHTRSRMSEAAFLAKRYRDMENRLKGGRNVL